MNPASARALSVLAALLLIVGWMVISPAGSLSAFLVAVLLVLAPVIAGPGRIRLLAVVLFLAALGSAAIKFPEFRQEQGRYQQHR